MSAVYYLAITSRNDKIYKIRIKSYKNLLNTVYKCSCTLLIVRVGYPPTNILFGFALAGFSTAGRTPLFPLCRPLCGCPKCGDVLDLDFDLLNPFVVDAGRCGPYLSH